MGASRLPNQMSAASVEGLAMARLFVGRRCVLGATLVVPLGVLWREYRAWASSIGAEGAVQAADLRTALEVAPWANVVSRPHARGRFKTLVEGVGLRPTAPAAARSQ